MAALQEGSVNKTVKEKQEVGVGHGLLLCQELAR